MKSTGISPNGVSSRQDEPDRTLANKRDSFAVSHSTGDRAEVPPVHLTPRQLEVLALLCEGLPNKLICRQLNISPGTVKVHISCILRELGVSSRLQAVVSARRFGLDAILPASSPKQRAYPGATEHRAYSPDPINALASSQWAVAA